VSGGEIAVTIVFLAVVMPIWLFLHYRVQWQRSKVLTADSERTLGDLSDIADRLEGRIGNLERLLDAAVPEWRKKP
jgi:phage shock protein B